MAVCGPKASLAGRNFPPFSGARRAGLIPYQHDPNTVVFWPPAREKATEWGRPWAHLGRLNGTGGVHSEGLREIESVESSSTCIHTTGEFSRGEETANFREGLEASRSGGAGGESWNKRIWHRASFGALRARRKRGRREARNPHSPLLECPGTTT